jgi:hypothetical protein
MNNIKPVLKQVASKAKLTLLAALLVGASSSTAVATLTASTAQAAGYPWGPAWVPMAYQEYYYLDCYEHGYWLQSGSLAYFLDPYGNVTTNPLDAVYVWAWCGP